MDSAGEDAHKRTGTSCIKTGPGDLFESTGDKVTAYSDGQYSGPVLLSENGGHKKFTNGLSFQTNLETAIKKKVTVTAEYLPSAMNKDADIESRRKTDFSEWKLAPSVFQRICENWKAINRPLCFQRVSPASNKCGLKERSIQCSNKCILNNLEQGVLLSIPSFLPNNTVLNKIEKDKTKKLVSITPCWQTQLWYPQILNMLIRKLVILPLSEKLLTRFVTNQTLTLVAWMASGDICLRKEFLSRQPILSPTQGDRVQYQITSRPGRSGLAGVIGGRLIHFDVL